MGEWRYSPTFLDLGARIGGWVGPRFSLDAVEKSKILHCRESNISRPACSPSLYLLCYPDSRSKKKDKAK
jgi:hypothetical protein